MYVVFISKWLYRWQVKMLKDVLTEWKREVEKKPPEMSVDQAYETLGLAVGTGGHEESKVRKAYFKMAQKYHPDKNPDGRVRLGTRQCSRTIWHDLIILLLFL